jgi:hypothetical protein
VYIRRQPTLQRFGMGVASPQAAPLEDRDAGLVPIVAQPIISVSPLPLAAPGPDALVAGRVDDLSAGVALGGIPLEPQPAVITEDDTIEGGQ